MLTMNTSPDKKSFALTFFLLICFTSYFMFSIAVIPHSAGVVYYYLLLRREARIPMQGGPLLFLNSNVGSFCA